MATMKPVILSDGSQPVLLAVLAHPDDETFGTGGTLALYAHRGVQVYLVCATRGEVGEMTPEMLQGYATIAEKREAELRCAADKLGLAGVIFLGYRDSGMPGSPDNTHPMALAAQPLEEVAAVIAHHIRKIKPQVVITFDPIGGYRHPDHIAVHNATVRAFPLAGDPALVDPEGLPPYTARKLYFQTLSRAFLRIAVRVLPLFGRDPARFGVNGDIDLLSLSRISFPTHAVVAFGPVASTKVDAAACHASQGGVSMNRGIQGMLTRIFQGRETFMRAEPAPRPGEPLERDLFAGI